MSDAVEVSARATKENAEGSLRVVTQRSADEVMTRNLTVGSGLNELYQMKQELEEVHERTSPRNDPPPLPPSARTKWGLEFPGIISSGFVLAASVFAGVFVFPPKLGGDVVVVPNYVVIMSFLVAFGSVLVGLDNFSRICEELAASGNCIPLTDTTVTIASVNKFANSAQVREKTLKIAQYLLRGASYAGIFDKSSSSHLKTLSKTASVSRRFFKFFRWVKHFDDLPEARMQKGAVMRALLLLRIATNFGADWAEDICSLERIGILPAGTLNIEFMLFAEYCQLVLAVVEVAVTTVRARMEQEVYHLAKTAGTAHELLVDQRRKLAFVRLELIKFISDIGKALYDCELHLSNEGVFIGCALFSAIISTHKNMAKALKSTK